MLAVARNLHRLLPVSRSIAITRASSPCSTYGSRAVSTLSETDQQEIESKSKSTWMKMKWLLPPAIFFCIGTDSLFKLLEELILEQECDSGLKLEVVEVSEIYPLSRKSSKNKEFRKVKCRGVFDESKSMLVLVNTPSRFRPFAYEYDLLTPFIPHPQTNPRTIVGAMGLDPNATLYVESIQDTSLESAVVSHLHEDRMLPAFAIRIKAHTDLLIFWYAYKFFPKLDISS